MVQLTVLSDEGDVVHVRGEGQLSLTRGSADSNPLETLLGSTVFGRKLLLGLASIDYIDSAGISWLITNHKHFRQTGGMLVLYGLTPRVRQVLHFCNLESVFHLADDEAAARTLARGEKGTP
jgi:anti-sigma B factor antagonist